MDSFNQSHQTTGFRYNPSSNTMNHVDGDGEFSGILEIYVHHARNIHNVCIYENQDVYAKFSVTYNPDETLSTSIINGGGKNPTFNENLRMKITQIDAVLKCEIWMLSRVRNYLGDQLLGFTLVPISQVVGKGKVTQDYSLSSTDLFHSPAGTVKLSLSLNTCLPIDSYVNSLSESTANSSSISSEVVLLDRKVSEVMSDPVEYSRIEFPDISLVKENQQMVTEYFKLEAHSSASRPDLGGLIPFIRLGSSPQLADHDYEMNLNSPHGDSTSPNESIHSSGFLSSTTTSLSDDRNSADSIEKRSQLGGDSSSSSVNLVATINANHNSSACPDTPTSKKEIEAREDIDSNFSNKGKESNKNRNMCAAKFGQVFSAPLGNINIEAEQSAMQKQIVDMYMRSMQQFTESLAKMKLPMDLDKPEREDRGGDVIQNHNNNKIEIDKKKKDGSRVFYGSRAFF
ncbi:Calcium-dependent lipid-binding domain-containing protein [Quillaja saponaria]|uniref:Calcium-dependent lipid-binding domain-containing protein n=1 Tax=Quillaja saponaria TaxID=32244 RepID=A0AAD7LXQ3_QUISA|nr:Calcium-dependent lipid-binding domain-containing protein [Quillaja saponaria]